VVVGTTNRLAGFFMILATKTGSLSHEQGEENV